MQDLFFDHFIEVILTVIAALLTWAVRNFITMRDSFVSMDTEARATRDILTKVSTKLDSVEKLITTHVNTPHLTKDDLSAMYNNMMMLLTQLITQQPHLRRPRNGK